jgi:hypothetical protein
VNGRARALSLAAVGALAACGGGPRDVKVGDAVLVLSEGDRPAAEAPAISLPGAPATLPDGQILRVAIDRQAPVSDAHALLARLDEAGRTPVLLVADRRGRVHAFERPPAAGDAPAIRLIATPDGKACVALPDVEEAKCVTTTYGHIDRAFTRTGVREAVTVSGLTTVAVEADPTLEWGDFVRTVDAARTCCDGVAMTVGLRDL